jgi:hypothetical protein
VRLRCGDNLFWQSRRSLVCAASTFAEKADVEIGVLTCALGEIGGAPPSDPPSGAQTRDALCTFKPRNGAEETYAAKVQGMSLSADQKAALIWVVKSATGAKVGPGLLQQSFTSDPEDASGSKAAPDWRADHRNRPALHVRQERGERQRDRETGVGAETEWEPRRRLAGIEFATAKT